MAMLRDPDPAIPEAAVTTSDRGARRLGSIAAVFALLVLGLWIVQSFLAALAWAGVLAIVSWPLYRRLVGAAPPWAERAVAPFLFTLALGLLFAVPVSFLGFEVAREIHAAVALVAELRKSGIAVPDWVASLPLVGAQAGKWWHEYLGDPAAARALLAHIDTAMLAETAKRLGGEVFHRLTIFFFTLLALFFLLRDGGMLTSQVSALNRRLFDQRGVLIAAHMVSAVQGTLYGLVLVGFAEGIVIGIAYLAVGLPSAVPIAVLTGVLAVIPFGAPVVFCAAALYLLSAGGLVPATIVLAVGFVVVFVADHVVRPILISGAARLPFLVVLLGILGGLQTFGVVGLFLGPAVLAALVSLWRDATVLPAPSLKRLGRRARGGARE
jgi:predicted PurR-regulated permease PerM